jgi:O-antigen/teichoic acid export membrane protein
MSIRSQAADSATTARIPAANGVISGAIYRRSDVTISLVDQVIVSGANFLTVIILARNFPAVAFGIFMVAQMVLALLTALQNTLVAQPHNILGAQRDGPDYRRLTAVLGLVQLVVSLVIASIVAFIGIFFEWRNSSENAHLMFALAITVPFWMGQEFVRRVLYTQNDVTSAAVNDTVSYGLQVAGVILVVAQFGGVAVTASNAMLALGGSSLIATVLGLWQLRNQLAPRVLAALPELRSLDRLCAALRETWELSKWLVAQQVVAWFGASGHGWILTALLGPASFGLYRAAYQIVNILNPFRQAAMNHLPSRAARVFAQSGFDGLVGWNRTATLWLSIPFSAAALIIACCAKPIAVFFYGPNLQLPNLHAIVAMGALAYTLNFARTPLDYAVLIGGGGRLIFFRALWLMAFVCTAGVALIHGLGVVGALISELAAALFAAVLTLRIYTSLKHYERRSTAKSENESALLVAAAGGNAS